MASVATLIDHGILEEDDINFFEVTRDWKLELHGGVVWNVERSDTNEYKIVREGKYAGHPVILTVGRNEDVDFTFFQRVDPSF